MIKFVDFNHAHLMKEIQERISKVVLKRDFINGEELQEFESAWAKYCGQKHCVGVSSGFHALQLAKESLHLRVCAGIAIPSNTFIATANAFSDKAIQFVEPNWKNHLVSRFPAETVLVPVHLYGQPCNMDFIMNQARLYSSFVIEDACQAHDANGIGKGDATCFSFYPSKNLGCFGDGGAVVTNNKNIAERVRMLANYGMKEKYNHEIVGYNCRLDTIQAAILNVKLPYLNEWNNARRDVAKQYHEELEGVNFIRLLPYNPDSVYHLFVIECLERDKLKQFLFYNGIETGIHYPVPIHKTPSYRKFNSLQLPVSERLSKEILSLPMHPFLVEGEVTNVCVKIKEICKDS